MVLATSVKNNNNGTFSVSMCLCWYQLSVILLSLSLSLWTFRSVMCDCMHICNTIHIYIHSPPPKQFCKINIHHLIVSTFIPLTSLILSLSHFYHTTYHHTLVFSYKKQTKSHIVNHWP